jgi:LysR family transcriptional regulator, glycine cleavage system transcriptional activator
MKCVPMRRLPPFDAPKIFEPAVPAMRASRGRLGSLVTRGAVSHQVKALEEELGGKLFNRERQRLVITQAGSQYLTI